LPAEEAQHTEFFQLGDALFKKVPEHIDVDFAFISKIVIADVFEDECPALIVEFQPSTSGRV
jgi:hypothetical protein